MNRDEMSKTIMAALDSLWVSDDRVLGKLHARDEIVAAITDDIKKALDDAAWDIHAVRFLPVGDGPDTFYKGIITARNIVRALSATLGGDDK